MDTHTLESITVYTFGNKNSQKSIWFKNEGIEMDDQAQNPQEFDKSGKVWKQMLKVAKGKLNSKSNFVCFIDEGADYKVESMFDLYQLSNIKSLKKQELNLAGINAKQLKNKKYGKVPSTYTEDQIASSEVSLNAGIKVIAHKTDYEKEAEVQLRNVALKHKDVLFSIGMPDLHPGNGYPIGSSVITNNIIYPPLIGTDIGCGMSFVKTSIPTKNIKPKTVEKWAKNLRSIDTYLEWDHAELGKFDLKWATKESVPILLDHGKDHFHQLGTIGAGNHFCELQKFEEVLDQELFDETMFDKDKAYILVHSGSRSYGKQILDNFVTKYQKKGIKGFTPDMPEYTEYLEKHDDACNYARRNRALIAYRFIKELLGNYTGEGNVILKRN